MRSPLLRHPTTVIALAALAGVAATGTAAATGTGTTPAPAARSCAHPKTKVLDTLGPAPSSGSVTALGRGTIAAGNSATVPAYWIGTVVHAIPFPAGYGTGTVNALNQHDLMVGTVNSTADDREHAFSYRIGDAKAAILPGGSYAADVNDSGQVVGGGALPDMTVYVWHGRTVQRELPLGPGFSFPHVSGINDAGTVVGDSAYSPPDTSREAHVGLVWQAGDTGPAIPLLPIDLDDDSGISYVPEDIDEHGRIVGEEESFWSGGAYETYWDAPYTADGTRVPGLPGYHDEGYFRAISPTTGLVAGIAPTSHTSDPPAGTAEIWTGSGPIRALPPLHPGYDTDAYAAADNGNVGGDTDDADRLLLPVIWTCAAQQAL